VLVVNDVLRPRERPPSVSRFVSCDATDTVSPAAARPSVDDVLGWVSV